MAATTVPAEVPISEARAILTDIATAAKEHGARTALTRHGKTVAMVVPSGAAVALDPVRVDPALRAVLAELDYDLHKEADRDGTYSVMVADFIRVYQRPMPVEEDRDA